LILFLGERLSYDFKTRLTEIFDEIVLQGLAEIQKSDVGGLEDQEALHIEDTEVPKTRFHQCHRECPCKIPEQITPHIVGISTMFRDVKSLDEKRMNCHSVWYT
jgi:hypothetical protein